MTHAAMPKYSGLANLDKLRLELFQTAAWCQLQNYEPDSFRTRVIALFCLTMVAFQSGQATNNADIGTAPLTINHYWNGGLSGNSGGNGGIKIYCCFRSSNGNYKAIACR